MVDTVELFGMSDAEKVSRGLVFPDGVARASIARGDRPTLLNVRPELFPQFRRAKARVLAGTGLATIAFIGDSTTMGSGSGSPFTAIISQWPNARARSPSAQLAKMLNQGGIPTTYASWFGDGGASQGGVTMADIDSRIAMGSGWASLTSNTLGGRLISNGTTTNPITFTPAENVNSVDIWYIRNTGFGTFTVAVDGSVSQTINADGAAGNVKATIPLGTAGVHSVAVQRTGVGGAVTLHSMDAYRTDLAQLRLYNMGWAGSRASFWSGRAAFSDPLWQIYNIAPALTFINLGINDARGSVSIADYTANMQFIIDKVRDAGKANAGNVIVGDICLVVPTPYDAGATPGGLATILAFRDAVIALGVANNLPVLDLSSRWGGSVETGVSISNSLGYFYDTTHPNAIGYADVANALYSLISGL